MQNKANISLAPKGSNLNLDVTKIVKYTCITSVLIIAIIFGTRTFIKMLQIKN